MTATVSDTHELPGSTSSAPAPRAAKPSRAKIVFPVLLLIAAAFGAVSYARGVGKESTDDAFVEGHVANVAPRVSGQVKRVLVKDNQAVQAGDVVVELDDRDQKVRLAAARADLAAAKAQLLAAETQLAVTEKSVNSGMIVARGGVTLASAAEGTTRAGIVQARADVQGAESRAELAKLELTRTEQLFASGAVSKAELDTRKTAVVQADAAVTQAKARVSSAEANLSSSAGTIESARGRLVAAESGPEQVEVARAQVALGKARVEQAQAALDQAELSLSYTRVKAEAAGVVSRRSVEPGQLVSPDRPLMALVALDDVWIVANFKEDQLSAMRPGQKVTLSIDTYGGKKLQGHVDSLAAGTGSRFSLLPPDNASGNFTKVVQRVPVLIKLDGRSDVVLRPGMSANVTVTTQ